MAELPPLAQNIWRRYGDAPGLVRAAPFLRAFERAERMSRLPLLDMARRWVPAEGDTVQAMGRGFADFAVPGRGAFPSERWPGAAVDSGGALPADGVVEPVSAFFVSEARQDVVPAETPAAAEAPRQEPASDDRSGSGVERV